MREQGSEQEGFLPLAAEMLTWEDGLVSILPDYTGNVVFLGVHKVHWSFLSIVKEYLSYHFVI